MNNKLSGDTGEKEVVELVPCPNCGKKLMTLPQNFPMYDVQCTGCTFRAQVKTNNCEPKNIILGAGYDIYEKVLKAGYLSPPLIVNFKWKVDNKLQQKIIFYPFVAKWNIDKYKLSPSARRANYMMFKYIKLDEIPSMVLYEKTNP
jgi:DNA-directed RNA polymerase subunit RPC12/RpoP